METYLELKLQRRLYLVNYSTHSLDKFIHQAIEKHCQELYDLLEDDENDIIDTWNDVIKKALEVNSNPFIFYLVEKDTWE